ncbi:MAG TPA: FtsX-like permease family protein [Sphingopyxis sp.]|jgi:predicted lysophospholipase L1 biosynthesis ABC-type transport system permease subunit|uniref:ABC transporter permease n=1 Tax=Sphingopyxis sp. TaxID=1908224 RepID=UPI002E0D1B5A|nr:FtsX-like permease family protein [Sphingopyxis sp.]
MNRLTLILGNSWRDLRGSDGRISMATQTALLFFLMTLTLTSASIQNYLADNLDQMLGSDLVVESPSPLAKDDEAAVRSMAAGLSVTQLADITLTHKDEWARVQLKLVDDAYPLQGHLQIGDTPVTTQRAARSGPKVGEIWIDSRLAIKLGTRVGDNLTIGGTDLRLSAILFHEPDRIMEGHSVAMRAMVHSQSLAGTAIMSSKDRTRYLVTADESQQQAIEKWSRQTLPGARVIRKFGGQHPLASFWQRTENFLGLASVILFFMGAVALDMTNRRWLAKMRYRLALYASFGTPTRTAMLMALGEWLAGFLLSIALAGTLAIFAYGAIVAELQGYFPGLRAGWHVAPALTTIGLFFLLLLALQIPSFIRLSRASLLSLIRNPTENSHMWQRLFWSIASVTLLAAAYSDNMLLTGMTLTAIAAALALMLVLTWTVIRLGDAWGRRRAGLLPFAFFMMRQRLFAKSAQVMGLGLSGLLLLFSLMLMRDLGTTMEGYSRNHDGNLMIAEAQTDQIDAIKIWAEKTGSSVRSLRPFVSAQLVAVNGKAIAEIQKPSDTLATLKDPIRLSWTDAMPKNNRLDGGKWWSADTDNWQQISAESEVMTDMGFSYGDTLTYQIGGKPYDFTLVASHAYQPGAGSITFWFQLPLSARAQIDAPTRYMGSMELPEPAWDALAGLWEQYPTLSLVPLQELTERFDQTLGIVTKVTSGYAAMVLLLALFVLAASVSGFSADDRQKNGLLMSMGLRDTDCLKLNFYDWGVTALIAAAGAVAGTWSAGLLIYQAQFNLTYNPDILWAVAMVVAMVATVCFVGYLACRQSLKVSVRDLMAT